MLEAETLRQPNGCVAPDWPGATVPFVAHPLPEPDSLSYTLWAAVTTMRFGPPPVIAHPLPQVGGLADLPTNSDFVAVTHLYGSTCVSEIRSASSVAASSRRSVS